MRRRDLRVKREGAREEKKRKGKLEFWGFRLNRKQRVGSKRRLEF